VRTSSPRFWQTLLVALLAMVCVYLLACGGKSQSTSTAPTSSESVISKYERNDKKDRVIVFVHGIFGSAKDTWACPRGDFYWPRALLADPAFADSDVYIAAYDSPYFGNHMTIDEVVSNLANRFQSDGVFSHREVVFVAHSLGGLVVQRFLITHREYAKQVPLILFYSTPETGAQIAELGNLFSADPLLKEMLPGEDNDYLLNLENEWIVANFAIKRYCAYEKKPTKGIWVVDRLSGTRGCTNKTPIPINKDHIDIVKPCSTQDDAYIALKNIVTENPIAPAPARKGAEPGKNGSKAAADTLNEMKLARRAWVAPTNARLTEGLSVGEALKVEVQYANVGKEPALDVRPIYTFKQVSGVHFADNTFNSLIEADNICKDVKPAPGADVIYPGQPDGYKLLFGLPPNWAGEDFATGKSVLVLEMCFAYSTVSEVHRTSLCYFFRNGVSPKTGQMNICTAGNHAN